MRKRNLLVSMLVTIILIFCMEGCGRNTDAMPQEEASPEKEEDSTEPKDSVETEKEEREEIPIDYPFDSEDYQLTLAKLPGETGEYELMLYGKDGETLQQIPCGKLAEPVTFSYDRLARNSEEHDLEIFPSEGMGLLFLWREERFTKEAIEIPRYVKIRGRYMIEDTEEGDRLKRQIYLVNDKKGRTDEIRSYCLESDTGQLTIWDNLENVCLYDGAVALDKEKQPVNDEYFDMLLWKSLSAPADYNEQTLIPVWVGESPETEVQAESGYEKAQNVFFGNPGYTQDFESRETLLEEFGFEGDKPMYQYFDQFGNLKLELYMDESREQICGIVYEYYFNSDLEKKSDLYGFTLRMLLEGEWEERDKYSLKNLNGYDGSEYDDWIKDYEVKAEYREDGRPDYFESTGRIDDSPERSTLLSINFVYREDGTLYYRDYDHNSLAFETFLSYLDSYYDEKERVVYEKGYITHGHVEYYYIYEGESNKPAYCLYLDHNLGYVIPQMIRYQ